MVGKKERKRRRSQDQPTPLWLFQISEDTDEEQQRAADGVDIVANVAALIQNRWRDENEKARRQRAVFAQELRPAQQPRHGHHHHTEKCRTVSSGRVTIAKKQIDQRAKMEKKRTVHERVMPVTISDRVDPRVIRVK